MMIKKNKLIRAKSKEAANKYLFNNRETIKELENTLEEIYLKNKDKI